jgi:hypothetical protein
MHFQRTRVIATVLNFVALVAIAGQTSSAATIDLIHGGDFEFFGFGPFGQFPSGDGQWYLQSGTHNPLTGTVTVPAPPGGKFAAMTDGGFPGEHILYQSIFVPDVVMTATLQFSRYINNATFHSGPFVSPPSLQYAGFDNQQARVDFITSTSIPDSTSPTDVLLNVFQTQPGDPLISGYVTQTVDVTALLQAHTHQVLRLRFAETNNLGIFYFGIDNVSLVVATPEPATFALAGFGCVGLVICSLRRRNHDGFCRRQTPRGAM